MSQDLTELQSAPVPYNGVALRGGGDDDTEPEGKTNEEGDDFDEEDGDIEQNTNANILTGNVKETIKDPEEEEKRKKRRRRAAILLLFLLAIVGVIIWLFLGHTFDQSTTARAVAETFAPTVETSSPTAKTESPSHSPSTAIPSQSPTVSTPPTTSAPTLATLSPTFSSNLQLSALACEELIVSEELQQWPQGIPFKSNYSMPDGRTVCADTYVGFPEDDDRNPWTARVGQKNCWEYNYTAGTEVCETVGARRCSADELQFEAGQGSGCFGDNTLLYSGSECELDGVAGIYTVNLELKNNATFFECETDLSKETLVRCCGDHRENY